MCLICLVIICLRYYIGQAHSSLTSFISSPVKNRVISFCGSLPLGPNIHEMFILEMGTVAWKQCMLNMEQAFPALSLKVSGPGLNGKNVVQK